MHLRLKTIPLFGALMACLSVAPASAEEVTLRSLDGSVAMTGELVSFDGDTYTLNVSLGEFSVSASEVICEGEFCPIIVNSDFRLAGASTLAQILMPSLFQDFSGSFGLRLTAEAPTSLGDVPVQPYIFSLPDGELFADVEVHTLGSQAAFASLLQGKSEIALSSRAITSAELGAFSNSGLGDLTDGKFQLVAALDGLIVIVPPENTIPTLSVRELSQVFAGQITNWSQLGGSNAPINVYRRDDESGSAADFNAMVMNTNNARFAASATTFTDDINLVRAVSSDPNGIGFTSIAYQQSTRAVPLRGTCGFVSTPSEFTVKTGEYPLARRVYLYTTNRMFGDIPKEKADKALGFLQFVKSDAGQDAAEGSGFVSQLISSLPIAMQGQRLVNTMLAEPGDVLPTDIREMVSELSGATRLSSTFRFKPNATELDAQARGDIPRLVAYLRNNDFAGRELLIAGFSDAAGGSTQNAALSRRRAQQVHDEIQAALGGDAGNYSFVVKGFGEVSPQGCNDSLAGRSVNRRVEVWVREAT